MIVMPEVFRPGKYSDLLGLGTAALPCQGGCFPGAFGALGHHMGLESKAKRQEISLTEVL